MYFLIVLMLHFILIEAFPLSALLIQLVLIRRFSKFARLEEQLVGGFVTRGDLLLQLFVGFHRFAGQGGALPQELENVDAHNNTQFVLIKGIIVINLIQMFLTNKTKTVGSQKAKVTNNKALGGWDDDQEETNPRADQQYGKVKDNKHLLSNLAQVKPKQNIVDLLGDGVDQKDNRKSQNIGFSVVQNVEKGSDSTNFKTRSTQKLYSPQQIRAMPKIDCERKIVEEVLALGGIRVKQADSVLNQFYNEAKAMEIPIIGSLLICQLYRPGASFQVKAKCLYAIEHLCKKSVQYSVYFKLHSEKINDCPDCEEHLQNFLKIKKGLSATLGASVIKPEQRKLIEEEVNTKASINFIDPGYNNFEEDGVRGFLVTNKKNSQKGSNQTEKPNKKLISPLDAKTKQKKVLQGPTKTKKQGAQQFNLLGENEPVAKNQEPKRKASNLQETSQKINLIDMDEDQKKSEDLLQFFEGGSKQQNGELI